MPEVRHFILIVTLGLCLIANGCQVSPNARQEPKMNLLPMYGHLPKSKAYTEADQQFLASIDSIFNGNRTEASQHYCKRGWQYFTRGFLDTAMFRFNQAWLLDSANGEVYWGFADILSKRGQYKEAVPFFERATKTLPTSSNLWRDASLTQGQLFFQTKEMKYLDTSILYSKMAITCDPANPMPYGDLAGSYSYFMQKDSARKYLDLADKLDPRTVNPEVRRMLTGK
jgi:tetratricopeptide (TPR) repeat protein